MSFSEEKNAWVIEAGEYPIYIGNSVKNKRLAAIFITSDGTATGKLIGMLTPWDIIGKE